MKDYKFYLIINQHPFEIAKSIFDKLPPINDSIKRIGNSYYTLASYYDDELLTSLLGEEFLSSATKPNTLVSNHGSQQKVPPASCCLTDEIISNIENLVSDNLHLKQEVQEIKEFLVSENKKNANTNRNAKNQIIDNLSQRLNELEKKMLYYLEQSTKTYYTLSTGISEKIDLLEQKVENISSSQNILPTMKQSIDDISYIIRNSTSNESERFVESLQQKLETYQEDFQLKMMRQYILDTYIDLYTKISHEIFENEEKNYLRSILLILDGELKSIGVELVRSLSGTVFDPRMMEVSSYEKYTNDETLLNKIANPVVPAFIWRQRQDEGLLLKKEEVQIYKIHK